MKENKNVHIENISYLSESVTVTLSQDETHVNLPSCKKLQTINEWFWRKYPKP